MRTQPAVVLRMVPLITVMGTIFFLSHQTGDSGALSLPPGVDKLGHFLVYGVLAVSLIYALVGCQRTEKPWKVICFTLLFCFAYGLSDEFHQSFVPGRFVSGFDLLADCLGAGAASVCWLKYQRRRLLTGSA